MIPLILSALYVTLSGTFPLNDDSCSVCSRPKPVPGRGDSVRVAIFVWPQGMYFRAWRDTISGRRGDRFTYTHAAACSDYHTATLTTGRRAIGYQVPRWLTSTCPRSVLLVPKEMKP